MIKFILLQHCLRYIKVWVKLGPGSIFHLCIHVWEELVQAWERRGMITIYQPKLVGTYVWAQQAQVGKTGHSMFNPNIGRLIYKPLYQHKWSGWMNNLTRCCKIPCAWTGGTYDFIAHVCILIKLPTLDIAYAKGYFKKWCRWPFLKVW